MLTCPENSGDGSGVNPVATMALVIRHVSKTYPNGVQALKDVSLTIPPGMYGLLGPNGAGKSTLMRILATLQEPDAGSIHLAELDVVTQKDDLRKTLGYLPQEFGVYPNVTAETLLDHFALLKGIGERRGRAAVVEGLLRQVTCGTSASKSSVGSPVACGSVSVWPSRSSAIPGW